MPKLLIEQKASAVRNSIWNRDYLADQPYTTDSSPVPVPERGWKVRIVSRSCGFRVAHSHSYRRSLIKRLMSRNAFSLPQSGELDFLPIGNVKSHYQVFSADLSAATDMISHELLRDMAIHMGIPPDFVCGGSIYLDGTEADMTRGTLMGIPLSFPFLNLIHIYLCDMIRAPRDSYYVMGDDLVAVWSDSLISRYKRKLTKLTGMVSNEKKSFTAPTRGIFCERAYHLSSAGLHANRQYLSVRGLLPFGKITNAGQVDQPGLPWELSPLLYLASVYKRVGHSRAFYAQSCLNPSYTRKVDRLARKHGISLYLPIHLGGAGLIPRKGNFAFSLAERTALDGFVSGDPECQARMRAVRLGTNRLKSVDDRSAVRFERASKFVTYRIDGSGLGAVETAFKQLREFCEDLSSSEFRPTLEDVPTALWFRSLSGLPEPEEDVLCHRWRYSELLSILSRVTEDVSPEDVERLSAEIYRLLPPVAQLQGLERPVVQQPAVQPLLRRAPRLSAASRFA